MSLGLVRSEPTVSYGSGGYFHSNTFSLAGYTPSCGSSRAASPDPSAPSEYEYDGSVSPRPEYDGGGVEQDDSAAVGYDLVQDRMEEMVDVFYQKAALVQDGWE